MAVNKMDWQKNLLIAAILAVLLMLVIRFNTFIEHKPTLETPSAASVTLSENDLSVTDKQYTDIPTALDAEENLATKNKKISTATNKVHVLTDSLDMVIDPHGGDILRVALPRQYAELDTPDQPFVLIASDDEHIYSLQSGLIGANGTDTVQGRPVFSVAKNEYRLGDDQTQLIVDLTLQQDQIKITKRFTFTRGEYLVDVSYLVENNSEQDWNAKLYGQIKRDSQEFKKANALSMKPYLGAAITTPDENYKKVTFKDLNEKDFKTSKTGGWIAMVQHYFISAWIPDADKNNSYHLRKSGTQDIYLFGFTSENVSVPAHSQGTLKAQFYAGPKDTKRLKEISPYLNLTVDYGILWWIAQPLFWLLEHIHNLVGNWGIAIIGLTILVKATFFKLSASSYRSMAKMRKLAPKLAELKERCGDDKQKMSQEMMKLYKTEKVNPLGGCLPILVQMPVFLALYWTLMESVELRHAPFLLWIQDLSVKDPYFILPVIMGITMFIQMKLNPAPPDPMQAKVMQLMPIMFTFMFLWFPAGLVLYWVTNNSLGILQQWLITRQIEQAGTKPS